MSLRIFIHSFALVVLLTQFFCTEVRADEKIDVVIKGGHVVDGTGAPWFAADVGIDDGMIVRIGRILDQDAKEVIDARGLIVAPGFIDMMGQTGNTHVR